MLTFARLHMCVFVVNLSSGRTASYTLFSFIVKTLRLAWPKNIYCATFVTTLILAGELNKTLVHFDFH